MTRGATFGGKKKADDVTSIGKIDYLTAREDTSLLVGSCDPCDLESFFYIYYRCRLD